MRVKRYAYRLLGAVCAFATIACVDQSFDLNNISQEVTVGSGTTTLPLGYLETKSLGDMLGDQNVEGLTIDENGNFTFSYEGETETIDIEGISTEFEIPQIESSFDVDYPSFNLGVGKFEIEAFENINITGLEGYSGTSFTIPNGVSIPVSGSFSRVFEGEEFNVAIDVPEQVKSINRIYFRDGEGGHNGVPLYIHVDFNGLANVNGGGTLSFDFSIEGGSFCLYDVDGNLLCDGTTYGNTFPVASGATSFDSVVYVGSIVPHASIEDGHMEIPLKFTYNVNFNLITKGGSVNLNMLPKTTLDTAFECSDVEVSLNSDATLLDYAVEGGDPIEITGLPAELKMVNRVGMRQDGSSILNFYVHGMEWLGEAAEDIEVVVSLPNYLKLHHVNGESYTYDEATCELRTTVAQLSKGVKVAIEALDFGAEGLVPDNGEINLDFAPAIKANFKEGSVLNISELEHDGRLKIKVGIDKSNLAIESFSGKVDYTYEVEQAFAITGLDELDLDLEIDGVGLKPIIEVCITHPLTMVAEISGCVVPSVGGEIIEEGVVMFDPVELKAATFNNGQIESAEVKLILADESLRANYADAKYTFVACDVTKLLLGSEFPDMIDLKLDFSVDSHQMQTLYIAEDLSISYGYRFDLPIAVDGSFKVRYSDEIGELNSLFAQLADYDITVGDLAIIATVTNSTPLQLAAKATVKDVDGNDAKAQIAIADNKKIEGSADGVTPKESVLRFELDLEEGRVANVADVDGIVFELEATSAAGEESVPLNKDQYLGVKLQLELKGGISVDIADFNLN